MLKTNKDFRKILAFVFYTAMLLNKTLFCRQIWGQPFKNILGVWGFYDNGKLYTENVENILLFVPFQFFLMWTLKKNLWSTDTITAKSYYGKAILISFGTSLGIEMAQLFLKVGAFQLSDLFFNTLGGIIGAAAFQALERKRKRL
ncbi:MAG: VanZ family protein [Blautia sp.]|nr:VanZ family protein [Blautia sp.]